MSAAATPSGQLRETALLLGADARCEDGRCGKVTRVVVDPLARTVTHLVVGPAHRSGVGRLVPLSLVEVVADGVGLRCTLATFRLLEPAEATRFLPETTGGYGGFAPGQVLSWPYYGLGGTSSAPGAGLYLGRIPAPPVSHDDLPYGAEGVRRGQPVHATDGDLGKVKGVVVDRSSRRITHILLEEGHLWGRKQIAIPMTDVERLDEGVRLTITRHDVAGLPPVELTDDGPL